MRHPSLRAKAKQSRPATIDPSNGSVAQAWIALSPLLAMTREVDPTHLQHALEGERAALAVVVAEVAARGACALPLEAIGARAGVCVTLARNAIRLAAGDGTRGDCRAAARRPAELAERRPRLSRGNGSHGSSDGGRLQKGKPHGL